MDSASHAEKTTPLNACAIAPIWTKPCTETWQHILLKQTIVDIYNNIPQLPHYRPLQQRLSNHLKILWYILPKSDDGQFAGLWGSIYSSLITFIPFRDTKIPWVAAISMIWNKSQTERRTHI